jgi:MscS family membrane protein
MDMTLGLAWFENRLAGNEVWRILAWAASLLAAYLAGMTLRYYLRHGAAVMHRRGRELASLVMGAMARAAVFASLAVALKGGMHLLVMTDKVTTVLATATSLLLVAATAYVLYCMVDVLSGAMQRAAARTDSKLDDMLVPIVRRTLQITVVVLALIQMATILSDKPLTSLLAGLGVGGLAVALAAQETIKNFFGSITVLTDKPFELGDRVIVDGLDGAVEKVGFRSTSIRTHDGFLVTYPNGDLAGKAIQNVGRRTCIRRVMMLGVPYDTPPGKVRQAVDILRDLLQAEAAVMAPDRPSRVYFTEFGGSALTIQVIYWYGVNDYWSYLEFNERLNFEILRRFNEAGIEFAFPSQTLYVAGDRRRPVLMEGPGSAGEAGRLGR